eukprot:TRINITY_DN10868_c0_g2_i1.p1 TRINITY_DN10868_c0_g2~~TRINITY_DN10868_c0_g2_i1.p1  ORF type:complete len:406 (+),score=29.72 TRINITY_DN10868_c0_g2_i1:96-1313(+)
MASSSSVGALEPRVIIKTAYIVSNDGKTKPVSVIYSRADDRACLDIGKRKVFLNDVLVISAIHAEHVLLEGSKVIVQKARLGSILGLDQRHEVRVRLEQNQDQTTQLSRAFELSVPWSDLRPVNEIDMEKPFAFMIVYRTYAGKQATIQALTITTTNLGSLNHAIWQCHMLAFGCGPLPLPGHHASIRTNPEHSGGIDERPGQHALHASTDSTVPELLALSPTGSSSTQANKQSTSRDSSGSQRSDPASASSASARWTALKMPAPEQAVDVDVGVLMRLCARMQRVIHSGLQKAEALAILQRDDVPRQMGLLRTEIVNGAMILVLCRRSGSGISEAIVDGSLQEESSGEPAMSLEEQVQRLGQWLVATGHMSKSKSATISKLAGWIHFKDGQAISTPLTTLGTTV